MGWTGLKTIAAISAVVRGRNMLWAVWVRSRDWELGCSSDSVRIVGRSQGASGVKERVRVESSNLVDVTRQARSIGISRRCLMRGEAIGIAQTESRTLIGEQAAAKAMGILFWLKRAWEAEDGKPPPKVFEARTGIQEKRRFEVEELDGSILVGNSD